jgi:hypothetical protein
MLAFDHLVLYFDSIEKAQQQTSDTYHITTVKGGRHENWGTYNYLAFMNNNSYIEWLGIEDLGKANQSDNPLIQHTAWAKRNALEGPIQFALRTDNMDHLIEHFKKHHIPFNGPYPGSRKKPDGTVLKWRMLFPKNKVNSALLPFIIEWDGEGNRPNDLNSINSVSFSVIRVGVGSLEEDVKQFQLTYDLGDPEWLEVESSMRIAEWKIDNGKIQLYQGEKLEAEFENIIF